MIISKPQINRHCSQPFVPRQKPCRAPQGNRRKQMGIDIADTPPRLRKLPQANSPNTKE